MSVGRPAEASLIARFRQGNPPTEPSEEGLNWPGKPLVSHEVVVNLIGSTHTGKGLTIQTELDTNTHPKGIKVTDDELGKVNLKRDDFHDESTYAIAAYCSTKLRTITKFVDRAKKTASRRRPCGGMYGMPKRT